MLLYTLYCVIRLIICSYVLFIVLLGGPDLPEHRVHSSGVSSAICGCLSA